MNVMIYDEEEEYRLLEVEKKIAQLDFDAFTRGLSPAAANEKFEASSNQLWDAIPIPTDKPLSEYLPEHEIATEQAQHKAKMSSGFKP